MSGCSVIPVTHQRRIRRHSELWRRIWEGPTGAPTTIGPIRGAQGSFTGQLDRTRGHQRLPSAKGPLFILALTHGQANDAEHRLLRIAPRHPSWSCMMPLRAARICRCGRRVESGATCICVRASKAEADRQRPNAAARGYDAEWQALRAAYLKDHPRCCIASCSEPATEVDHILSVRERPDLRLARHNLRPFCKHHHSQRTGRDQSRRRPSDGNDVDRGGVQTFGQGGQTVRGRQREEISNSVSGKFGAWDKEASPGDGRFRNAAKPTSKSEKPPNPDILAGDESRLLSARKTTSTNIRSDA